MTRRERGACERIHCEKIKTPARSRLSGQKRAGVFNQSALIVDAVVIALLPFGVVIFLIVPAILIF